MKITIPTMLISFIIVAAIWYGDIAKDKENTLFVSAPVTAYNNWDCNNIEHCEKTFILNANTNYDVYRIRYGKDFMSIKIKNNNQTGWVIYGANTKLNKKSST